MIYNNSVAAGERWDKLKITLLRMKAMLEPLLAPYNVLIDYIGKDISQALIIRIKRPTRKTFEEIRILINELEMHVTTDITETSMWLRMPTNYAFKSEAIASEMGPNVQHLFVDNSAGLEEVKKFLSVLGFIAGRSYKQAYFNSTKDTGIVCFYSESTARKFKQLCIKHGLKDFLLFNQGNRVVNIRLYQFKNPILPAPSLRNEDL